MVRVSCRRQRLFLLLILWWSGCLIYSPVVYAEEITEILTGETPDNQASEDRVISADNSSKDDRKIDKRIQEIFSEIEGLSGVTVSVNSGIVTLKGEVDLASTESRALKFARQVEGVVDVKNELSVNRKLQPRLQTTWRKLVDLGNGLLTALPLMVLALLILLLFWFIGRWLAARKGLWRRMAPNPFIASLIGQFVQLLFALVGLVMALVLLDATPLLKTILGAAGIIGLAVGFAVRDTVENYIASILLSLRNPFEVNDFVNVDGNEGNVVKLTSRATVLLSPDGNHIRIPNAVVFKAVITNFTRRPERRFEFDVGVDTNQDLSVARTLALATLIQAVGVLEDPKPMVVIQALGDSNVVLRCYGWIDQRRYDFLKVRSEAIRLVKQAFDRSGIVMPEPVYKVRLSDTGIMGKQQVSESWASGPAQAKDVPAQIASEQVKAGDVSVDRTIERKVVEEEQASGKGNLLNPKAEREI